MESLLPPERLAQLESLALARGEDPTTVAVDLLTLGLDQQTEALRKKKEIRSLLDRRLADYREGRSVPLDGEEVFARLRERGGANQTENES